VWNYRSRYCFWLPLVVRYVEPPFLSSLFFSIQYGHLPATSAFWIIGYLDRCATITSRHPTSTRHPRDITIESAAVPPHITPRTLHKQPSGTAKTDTERECRNNKLTDCQITGFHVPAVRRRDLFYAKLEDQRAAAMGQA
jgi:hypothetical protein